MLPTRVRSLPQSIEIDQRPDKKSRQGFIGAPAAAGGKWEQTAGSLACSLPGGVGGGELVPYMG